MSKKAKDTTLVLDLGVGGPSKFVGKVMWIPIRDLDVDHSYQRDPVKKAWIDKTAANFMDAACGVINVGLRSTKKHFINDGQQRTLAAEQSGRTHMLCFVTASDGPAAEAKLYRMINQDRTNTMMAQRFKAAVVEGLQPQVAIDAYLKKVGLVAGPQAHVLGTVACMGTVIEAWTEDTEAAKTALRVVKAVCANCKIHNHIFKGLWAAAQSGFDIEKYADKIVRAGGGNEIIAVAASIRSGAPKMPIVSACGAAVRAIVARKKHKKTT